MIAATLNAARLVSAMAGASRGRLRHGTPHELDVLVAAGHVPDAGVHDRQVRLVLDGYLPVHGELTKRIRIRPVRDAMRAHAAGEPEQSLHARSGRRLALLRVRR